MVGSLCYKIKCYKMWFSKSHKNKEDNAVDQVIIERGVTF